MSAAIEAIQVAMTYTVLRLTDRRRIAVSGLLIHGDGHTRFRARTPMTIQVGLGLDSMLRGEVALTR